MPSDAADPLASAEAAIRAGSPGLALPALTAAVKGSPANSRLRIFLAQLLCVLGQWERAHTQLNVVAEMDPTAGPMREMVGHALRCEKIRAAVFDGRHSPMLFGEPEEWLATLIESALRAGSGDAAGADELGARALAQAPPSRGQINGTPFEWLADGDARLGPVLEAMVNGRYYCIPFTRLARIDIEPPTDLRDVVWLPAQLQFSNGGEVIAMIPTRYPGSERSDDGQILMARKTEWRPAAAGDRAAETERWFGLGQRVLITDAGEYDLLSVRSVEFEAVPGGADSETSHG